MGELSLSKKITRVKAKLEKTQTKKSKRINQPTIKGLVNYVDDIQEKCDSFVGQDPSAISKNLRDSMENRVKALEESGKPKRSHSNSAWLQRSHRRMQQIEEHLINADLKRVELPFVTLQSKKELIKQYDDNKLQQKENYDEAYEKKQRRASLFALQNLLGHHSTLITEPPAPLAEYMQQNLRDTIDTAANPKEVKKQRRTKQRFKLAIKKIERIMRQLAKKQHLDALDLREIESLQSLKIGDNKKLIASPGFDRYIDDQYKHLYTLKIQLSDFQHEKHHYHQQLALLLDDARAERKKEENWLGKTQYEIIAAQKKLLDLSWWDRFRCRITGRYLGFLRTITSPTLTEPKHDILSRLKLLLLPYKIIAYPLSLFFKSFITREKTILADAMDEQRLNMPKQKTVPQHSSFSKRNPLADYTSLSEQYRKTAADVIRCKRTQNLTDAFVDKLLSKIFNHESITKADAQRNDDLEKIIITHNEKCNGKDGIYAKHLEAVKHTLFRILDAPFSRAAGSTVDDTLTELGLKKEIDQATYKLGLKLYYFFNQHPQEEEIKEESNGEGMQKKTVKPPALLQTLYDKHFLKESELPAKQRLEDFSEDLHSIFEEIQSYPFEKAGLSKERLENAILKLKKDTNRFTEQFSYDHRLNAQQSGSNLYERVPRLITHQENEHRNPNYHLTDSKKQQDRISKQGLLSKANIFSFLLAALQGFLSFYALSGLTIIFGPATLWIALGFSLATWYSNYVLFKGGVFDLFKQMFLKKDYFNGFTSKKGKLGMGLVLFAAIFMSAVMAGLVGIAVNSVFSGLAVIPMTMIFLSSAFVTFVGFTGLMYVAAAAVTKAAVRTHDHYRKLKRIHHSRWKAFKIIVSEITGKQFIWNKEEIKRNFTGRDVDQIHQWRDARVKALSVTTAQGYQQLPDEATQKQQLKKSMAMMVSKKRIQTLTSFVLFPVSLAVAFGFFCWATVITLKGFEWQLSHELFMNILHFGDTLSHFLACTLVFTFTAAIEMTFNARSFFFAFSRLSDNATQAINFLLFSPLHALGCFMLDRGYRAAVGDAITGFATTLLSKMNRIGEILTNPKHLKETIYKGLKNTWNFVKSWGINIIAYSANAIPNGVLPLKNVFESGGTITPILAVSVTATTIQSGACNGNEFHNETQKTFPLNVDKYCAVDENYDKDGDTITDVHKDKSILVKVAERLELTSENIGDKSDRPSPAPVTHGPPLSPSPIGASQYTGASSSSSSSQTPLASNLNLPPASASPFET